MSEVAGLRERKKALTRRRILDEAERLFESRGFDDVTVAQIADAADVSVKTLFVYFRSKEDLAFSDTALIEAVEHAIQALPPDGRPADAVAGVLIRAAAEDRGGGLEGFRRGYGGSVSLEAGLARMWQAYEDRIVRVLEQTGRAVGPTARFAAIQLIGLIRVTTSTELADDLRGLPPDGAEKRLADVLAALAASTESR